MEEPRADLETTRRELVELRALAIKTHGLVGTVSADLRSIGRRQERTERRLRVGGAAVFVVGLLLVVVLGKVAWELRSAGFTAEREAAARALAETQARLADALAERERAQAARAQADAYYQLVTARRWRAVLEGYDALKTAALTPTEQAVFASAHAEAKRQLSREAYVRGLDFVENERWAEAEPVLRESLEIDASAPHASQARLELARSLQQLHRGQDALTLLSELSQSAADPSVMVEATFLLAEVQAGLSSWEDAKATLRSFLSRFPKSRKRGLVKLRLAELELLH